MVCLPAAEHVYQNKAESTRVSASECISNSQAKYAVPHLQGQYQCMQATLLSSNYAGAACSQLL